MSLTSPDTSYLRRDTRTRFAIWCFGEGWCPALCADVEKFSSFALAELRMDEWKAENPDSYYEIREVC